MDIDDAVADTPTLAFCQLPIQVAGNALLWNRPCEDKARNRIRLIDKEDM